MSFIVGAYVTSPCLFKWDELQEQKYFDALKRLDHVRGLEHPFWGDLHPFDVNWFLNNIEPSWDFVLTCIPGIMKSLQSDSTFGLASDDEKGRQKAIEFMKKAHDGILTINQQQNRKSVLAVHITSSPSRSITGNKASSESFQKSLEEICNWDWHN